MTADEAFEKWADTHAATLTGNERCFLKLGWFQCLRYVMQEAELRAWQPECHDHVVTMLDLREICGEAK